MNRIILLIFLGIPFFARSAADSSLQRNKISKPQIFKTGARPHLQIGLHTGVNFNYFIYNRDRIQKDVAAGYQGGLFFRVSRQKAFVQFEMNYLWSQVFIRNDFITSKFGNINFDKLTFRYNTFGIPFIFGAYAVKTPIFKLRFYNGIEADFIAKTRVLVAANSDELYKLTRSEKRSILRPVQFGYQLGMGMDIAMFIIDAKYNLAFRSFYKEQFRTQTHLFQITVGAIF